MAVLARCVVGGVAAGAVVLALLYHLSGLQTWWLELTRYAPYPIHLAAALTALGASLLLGWWWRALAVATLVLVLTAVMGLAVGRADTGTGAFRLMTYNVKAHIAKRRPDGVALLAQEVLMHDPDVLVMQDAGGLDASNLERFPALRGLLGGREVFHDDQYVVASRLPLEGCRVVALPVRDEARSYVRCTLVVAGSKIDLVVVHLVSPRQGLDAARREQLDGIGEWKLNFSDRLTQARKLAHDLAGNPRPLIVAGDLNSIDGSPAMETLTAIGLRDAFAQAGFGYGHTQGHEIRPHISFLRIDHVLVSRTLGVIRCFVGDKQASEHRPVIADLLVQRD
jgi:endonuclease/exonuclease/phosphatase (EEP) superfamily protein YafD